MDAVAPLLAAALTVVVGTLLGYIVGNRRLKYERILERRAEVIAEMTKMMASLQRSLDKMSRTGIDAEERHENRAQASQTLAELGEYFARNEVWLSRETCRKIEDLFFTLGMSLEDYLQVGHGPDPLENALPRPDQARSRHSRTPEGALCTIRYVNFREFLFYALR
jgi:hypothetical protein